MPKPKPKPRRSRSRRRSRTIGRSLSRDRRGFTTCGCVLGIGLGWSRTCMVRSLMGGTLRRARDKWKGAMCPELSRETNRQVTGQEASQSSRSRSRRRGRRQSRRRNRSRGQEETEWETESETESETEAKKKPEHPDSMGGVSFTCWGTPRGHMDINKNN